MNFRIERWNGQPGVAETLAAWHVREWAGLFAGWDESAARSEFRAQSAARTRLRPRPRPNGIPP